MPSITVPAPDTCARAGGCHITQVVEIDCHRWYAVIKIEGQVFGVVGWDGTGVAVYDSVEEWEKENS